MVHTALVRLLRIAFVTFFLLFCNVFALLLLPSSPHKVLNTRG